MRISDWSSDVCSSDLQGQCPRQERYRFAGSPGRDPDRPHQYADRSLQGAPQGQPQPPRPSDDGQQAPHPPRLSQEEGRGSLSGTDREAGSPQIRISGDPGRSEEHTSELQSLMRISYAVFCLKKKQIKHTDTNTNQ